MKRFLLFTFIALPTFLLAQPTLTFTPANGATNVSTATNLVIDSNEGLRKADGTSIDPTNVATLITLQDEFMNNVPFNATIDGPKRQITITPSSALVESTTFILVLQPVENSTGQE